MPETTPDYSKSKYQALPFAGFWLRVLALLIDGLILSIPLYLVAYYLSHDFNRKLINQPPPPTTLYHLFRVYFCWLYFAFFESSDLQATPGKLLFRLKVLSAQGKLNFMESTVRYFAKVLSITAFGLGGIVALFTKKKQAFHDLIVNTVVLKNSTGISKKPVQPIQV